MALSALHIDRNRLAALCRRYGIERLEIIGSFAGGDAEPESDNDVLVVERNPGDRRKESVRIRHALRGLGYPFDVIVISTEWFEESKNVIGGIAYPANKYGKVSYEVA